VKKQDQWLQNSKGFSSAPGLEERKQLDIMTSGESWRFWLNYHTAQLWPEGSPMSKKPRLMIRAKSP
jgi:hypothetical protein